jgi:serine protease inhibitor
MSASAAAFTRTDYGMGAPQSKGELDFILDRPFVFCIADGYESILFAGVVEHP